MTFIGLFLACWLVLYAAGSAATAFMAGDYQSFAVWLAVVAMSFLVVREMLVRSR